MGFRPFVYTLALECGLSGFVMNRTGSVHVEIQGEAGAIARFVAQVQANPPPLSRIESLTCAPRPASEDNGFRIVPSDEETHGPIFVPADTAPCDACRSELFNPMDRRFNYAFLNCTHCGPRFTIIERTPYDRERTTMATFGMCAECAHEYHDPADRRFHAQPTACPACGPTLRFLDASGRSIETLDPLEAFLDGIALGKVLALKGVGGYHLVCDAGDDRAVRALRRRKHRDEKPFALMAADLSTIETFCEVPPEAREALCARERPIVLLRRKPSTIAESVAPGQPFLGVMLPYSPLHHLILARFPGPALVMTSGNRSEEPLAYRDEEATARLSSIADGFLIHDRPIHRRTDDSVLRVVSGRPLFIRRSRGYAPESIVLPIACTRPILALGGHYKSTVALGDGPRAILGPHVGDLDDALTFQAYTQEIEQLEALFGIRPERVAHDRHPDYASTRYAVARGLPRIAVQHHHAHMASCMAEHGLTGPVIGVIFDGTGYGLDGAVWGGEFLVGDYLEARRAAHLRYVPMPGGARAIREPWRMALAYLEDAGGDLGLLDRIAPRSLETVGAMLAKGLNAPMTSSMGRLFDGAAALMGLRDTVSFEGQAAMQLEWLAQDEPDAKPYPFDLAAGDPAVVDIRPAIGALAEDVRRGVSPSVVSRRFHSTVVAIVVQVCERLRLETALKDVVLSGGVFMNGIIATESVERLTRLGFRVFTHRVVPPNDGGLSLGQLAIATRSQEA